MQLSHVVAFLSTVMAHGVIRDNIARGADASTRRHSCARASDASPSRTVSLAMAGRFDLSWLISRKMGRAARLLALQLITKHCPVSLVLIRFVAMLIT